MSQMCAWCAQSTATVAYGPVCGLACALRRATHRARGLSTAMGRHAGVIHSPDFVSQLSALPRPVRTAFVFEAAAVDAERSRDAEWALELTWDYAADVPEAHGQGPTRVLISPEEYRRLVHARAAEASPRPLGCFGVVDSERTSLEDWAAAVDALLADVWRTPPDA